MKEKQLAFLTEIKSKIIELSKYQMDYWESYSSFDTWQFWILILMIIVPLIVLLIFIDKRNILLIGFFGLNFHVWIAYVDSIGIRLGLWGYPYHLIPTLPSFSLDAALIPVSFMLLHQWALNNKKNTYLYAGLLSLIYAFIVKPIMIKFHFFDMDNRVNYFYLFLIYMGTFIVSKLITSLFVWLQQKETK